MTFIDKKCVAHVRLQLSLSKLYNFALKNMTHNFYDFFICKNCCKVRFFSSSIIKSLIDRKNFSFSPPRKSWST